MLQAIDEKGNLINLLDTIPEGQEFYCPGCHSLVRLRKGKVVRPYFAHVSLERCTYTQENESAEHLGLKAALYQQLSSQHQVTIEAYLAPINQVADLLVEDKLALEVQCSPLSVERLQERTSNYQELGYQVRWLLGRKLWVTDKISPLQKQFLYFSRNMGFHLWELDSQKKQLRLKYLIYEDITGKLYYQQRVFSFDTDLLEALRLPYRSQHLTSYQVSQKKSISTYIQRQLRSNNKKWLRQQEEAYLAGDNLLTKPWKAFYPQVRPIISNQGFCQIKDDLEPFYRAFTTYYQALKPADQQTLYPPAFYLRSLEESQKNGIIE